MNISRTSRITSADRLDGSILVSFADGRSGLFSASLLHALLPQAEELFDAEPVPTHVHGPDDDVHLTLEDEHV